MKTTFLRSLLCSVLMLLSHRVLAQERVTNGDTDRWKNNVGNAPAPSGGSGSSPLLRQQQADTERQRQAFEYQRQVERQQQDQFNRGQRALQNLGNVFNDAWDEVYRNKDVDLDDDAPPSTQRTVRQPFEQRIPTQQSVGGYSLPIESAPAPARPLFAEPLSSFVQREPAASVFGNPALSGGSPTASDWRTAVTTGTKETAKELPSITGGTYLEEINEPSKTPNEHFARKVTISGEAVKSFKYGVQDVLFEKNSEDSMGFGKVLNSWMEYGEDATEGAGTWSLGGLKSLKDAGSKVRKAWGEFLDEGLVKDFRSVDAK